MGSRANVPAAGTGTASREHGAAADARRPPGQPVASRAPEYAVVPDASEADLLPALGARLAAGDQHALEQAYRLLGPSVLAYARRYVGPSEAPDVVQRVFVDVWQSAGRYDPDRSLHAWVFTIAKRRVTRSSLPSRSSVPAVKSCGSSGAFSVQAAADCDSAAPGCPRTDSARDTVFHLRPTGCGQARREGRA